MAREEQAFADMLQEREREREDEGGREREAGGQTAVGRPDASGSGSGLDDGCDRMGLDYRDSEFLRHWERLVDLEQAESEVGVECCLLKKQCLWRGIGALSPLTPHLVLEKCLF